MATIALDSPDRLGTFWDNYNIIAACQRLGALMGRKVRGRGIALGIFSFALIFSLVFWSLWVMMDFLSTWQWSGFLTPELEAGVDYMAVGVGGTTAAALALRAVLQLLSLIPTIAELLTPFFADADKMIAGIFIAASAFDFYTDWDKAAAVAANMSYEGWGSIAPVAEWGATVLIALFCSLILQYIAVLFTWILIVSAWIIVFGPRNGGRR